LISIVRKFRFFGGNHLGPEATPGRSQHSKLSSQHKRVNLPDESSRNILLILLAFLGLGAMFGGGIFILSPTGKLFGMPLSMLNNSPFANFLIPGIVLFVVLGLAPLGLIIALVKKPEYKFFQLSNFYKDMYWGWTYVIYVAFALIIWIQVEMTVLRAVHWSHSLYMCLAIAILFVALMPKVRTLYRK